MNIQEATTVFNEYLKELRGIIVGATYGSEGVAAVRDQFRTTFTQTIPENTKTLNSARQEQLENGSITIDTYKELSDAGLSKYVKVTSKGYELAIKEAGELLKKTAFAPLDELQARIDFNNAEIKRSQVLVDSLNKEQQKSLDDALAKLKAGTMTIGDSAFKSLDGNVQELAQAFYAAGVDGIEPFIKLLKEANVEMDKITSETYIEGLAAYKEGMMALGAQIDEVNKELEKLDKELADLNKDLEKANKELEEAKQAQYEAYHGTDDWDAGLDGLYNYTQQLEIANTEAEKLSNSIENISNVSEGAELFRQQEANRQQREGNLIAQNRILQQSRENAYAELEKRGLSQYVQQLSNGAMSIDVGKLATLDDNDEIKNAVKDIVEQNNAWVDSENSNKQQLEEIDKERNEQHKQYLDDYVSVQESVIDILKE